jgi:basic amino acid/polyamine antiporter, APA family
VAGSLFRTKSVDRLIAESESGGERTLKRTLGGWQLVALGIGAIIGAGLFVRTAAAIAERSGPAVTLAFLVAAVGCLFAGLCYAEFASMIPIAGSAYTYSYATMGEFVAWIIGWDLVLEYGVSVAAVAVGWGAYFTELLDSLFGITLSDSIALPPGEGGQVNVPAAVLVLAVTALLIFGVRESARSNSVMVIIKLTVLAFFIAVGVTAFTADHFSDFAPNGFNGVIDGAALIFFAYIGFDAVSTASEESRQPGRDLPIAIVGSLVICTAIYIAVSTVAMGALPADQLAGDDAPLATALSEGAGISWAADIVTFGALVAITSVVLTICSGRRGCRSRWPGTGCCPPRCAR